MTDRLADKTCPDCGGIVAATGAVGFNGVGRCADCGQSWSLASTIVERYPVNEWPVGPPHEFSPAKAEHPETPCTACGATRAKAIHSEAFWRKYDHVPGPFPSASDYIEWKNQ